MGKQSNQQFVQMPLARLKERIKQLCEIYGIRYVESILYLPLVLAIVLLLCHPKFWQH